MNIERAIDILKEHLAELHEDNDIYENGKCNVIYALEEVAIPAMEKEICKDVEIVGSNVNWGRKYFACPSCRDFIRWRHDVDKGDYQPPVCPSCGQNLNWSVKTVE